MRVFFQRGSSSGERKYRVDLDNTVRGPVPLNEVKAIAQLLQGEHHGAEALALLQMNDVRMWGGPPGIKSVFHKMEEGDLMAFILDDRFVYLGIVDRPWHISPALASEIASLIWTRSDYPYIWTIRSGFALDVWRREIGKWLTGDDEYFVRVGSGRVFYYGEINLNFRDSAFFAKAKGLHNFLQRLGLSSDDIATLAPGI